MRELGVRRSSARTRPVRCNADVQLGEFVICDQFVDRTWGRKDTFYDGPVDTRLVGRPRTAPSCGGQLVESAAGSGITAYPTGTVVVIQGPRFSTRAESRWFASQGWEVINMTQYPECYLARELEICYCNISLITDHDVGVEGAEPGLDDEVVRVFNGEQRAPARAAPRREPADRREQPQVQSVRRHTCIRAHLTRKLFLRMKEVPDEERLLEVAAALASPHRLKLIALLTEGTGGEYVSQLARARAQPRPLTHMHLQKLEAAGLVSSGQNLRRRQSGALLRRNGLLARADTRRDRGSLRDQGRHVILASIVTTLITWIGIVAVAGCATGAVAI